MNFQEIGQANSKEIRTYGIRNQNHEAKLTQNEDRKLPKIHFLSFSQRQNRVKKSRKDLFFYPKFDIVNSDSKNLIYKGPFSLG